MKGHDALGEAEIVAAICALDWQGLTRAELMDAMWAYYFFSIQFRENLLVARALFPGDAKLKALESEECDTANLSPYPGVADEDERLNHDEFMRRAIGLVPMDARRSREIRRHGTRYLEAVRRSDPDARALSIASYERGGLEQVFRAILTAPHWDNPALAAFHHFLRGHLQLDDHHGSLVGHLNTQEKAAPLWLLFHDLLLDCVPCFARAKQAEALPALIVCMPAAAQV